MIKKRYVDRIIDFIRQGRSVPNWSVSDYLDPIRDSYARLPQSDKKAFRASLLELLHGTDYLEDIITICMELKVEEACPVLVRLFLHPPSVVRYEGRSYPTWRPGFRRTAVAGLGKLHCQQAAPLLKRIVESKISKKKNSLPRLDLECYGAVVHALTSIAPDDSAKYFGWWMEREQQLTHQIITSARQTDDWKTMERLAIPIPVDERESPFVQGCLLAVATKSGLRGLKKWLHAVCLPKEDDRDHLRYQLEHMLTGKDPLSDLKTVLRFTGDARSLASELASLPSLKPVT